ncbi:MULTISPECIES: GGDEF domain-containing protein [unclassified Acinetobacter]|jgi:diguanylate cyclase (GGDEF)-like protein|uniref:GGDEF domain-containing protein n=1 Tax=unclassified Acinetobacter TaxID=196816 RepID=UPI000A342E25|nr:GGDEF domain-containing protein [Acinetobacter sp. ANC 4218]OTG71429.1 GGDEF domain-containing protein [Acinetobacter sp. ANC 4218]
MYKLRSEHISRRLFWSMIIIALSLLFLSVPLIVSSYHSYQKADRALTEISALRAVADLANKISRERAPANKVMSSSADELAENIKELEAYRKEVDLQIEQTSAILATAGFSVQAQALSSHVKGALAQGRHAVDVYSALPRSERSARQLDQAIQQMFKAWDSCKAIIENVLVHSEAKGTSVSDYYTLILILADLRDQAGRTASNIMAAVTFNEKIPEDNLARSLQTQHQAHYLWALVNTIQPEQDKTPEYLALHQQVKAQFLDQGIPIITRLMNESIHNQAYSLTGTQLTEAMVDKFLTVVNLQSYILDYSVTVAQTQKKQAQQKLILTLLVALICLVAVSFTMIYARNHVFIPLLKARNTILRLAQHQVIESKQTPLSAKPITLLDALKELKRVLQQRDALEFQLRNIANTDNLTGVSNRLALEEYIRYLENKPNQFKHTGLIIIDIDDFKHVNDTFGHIVGDEVIKLIAEKLQLNVRASDLIVRYGGDEFLVLIEHINFPEAWAIANKILQEIGRSELYIAELNQNIRVSVSAGVVVGGASWMSLLEKADKSLFQAKAKGKNKVAG